MTVAELIEKLQTAPSELPVYFDDYEQGCRDVVVTITTAGVNSNGTLGPSGIYLDLDDLKDVRPVVMIGGAY